MYARNYTPGPMWESECVTEVMGRRKYRVKLLNEDQLWHRHQNQMHYSHVEDNDTQCAEFTVATGIFPITGDSETTASDSSPATNESLRRKRHHPLWDHSSLNRYS